MSQDFPFSINSKYTIESEYMGTLVTAEHLVSVRAANAADMARRLNEATLLFPFAVFVTADLTAEAPATDYPGRPFGRGDFPDEQRMVVPPDVENPNPNGNGNGHRTPVAAAVAGQTQRATARAAQGRVERRNDTDPAPVCPDHGIGIPSKKAPGGLYCPRQQEDGTYCKWHS